MPMIGKIPFSEISLYFHIPFCTHKCHYCHFYVLPDQEINKQKLFDALQLHWESWLPLLQDKCITSIYFGGGTPSLFGPSRIASILNMIKQSIPFSSLEPEITLEANPENIHFALIKEYAQAGINRVSIGIQTLDESLLKLLGRLHQPDKALDSIHVTYEAGIRNISIDLMYDLPQQTLIHWEQTLQAACRLPITHLSLYNLTIEPHTLFFKRQNALQPLLPDQETSLAMYERAIELLEERGLKQYEISAFAQPGYQSRHNTGYWTARPFLGFGPSAFSYWEGKRFRCIANLNRYEKALKTRLSPLDFEEQLDPQAHLRELFVIQLRLQSGISLTSFQKDYGKLGQETVQTLKHLSEEGFLRVKSDHISLTKRGVIFYNRVAAELI